ncbi:MAG: hypothetical protein O6853_01490 [Actinobacteria bacterium]|nr:hypothetical protein [Actinomycetota bacterium]
MSEQVSGTSSGDCSIGAARPSRFRARPRGQVTAAADTRTEYRTYPLREATCGLEITIKDDAVRRIRGDRDNVFSPGFICPMSNPMAGICSLGAAS